MKAAVLDDNPQILRAVKTQIDQLIEEEDLELDVKYFEKSSQISFNEEDARFHVYILDIETNEKDTDGKTVTGLDFAKEIRKKDRDAYIVFLTSHPEFALDGYEVRAYRYIMKDDFEIKLKKTLLEICCECEEDTAGFYSVDTNSKHIKIFYRNLYSVTKEKEQKNVAFNTNQGEIKYRTTLQEVYKQLPHDQFIFVDRATIVNIGKIDRYANGELYLINGVNIKVSRSHRKEIITLIGKYWRKRT